MLINIYLHLCSFVFLAGTLYTHTYCERTNMVENETHVCLATSTFYVEKNTVDNTQYARNTKELLTYHTSIHSTSLAHFIQHNLGFLKQLWLSQHTSVWFKWHFIFSCITWMSIFLFLFKSLIPMWIIYDTYKYCWIVNYTEQQC